jgi:hypothetical protein
MYIDASIECDARIDLKNIRMDIYINEDFVFTACDGQSSK